MPQITFPDGQQKYFDQPITVAAVATSLGANLGKAALAAQVNSCLVNTDFIIDQDSLVTIITAKTELGLTIIRHSTAHLLAQAVKQLYPTAQVTIGPVIEAGFYYDFYYPLGFKPEDLQAIETRMYYLAKQDYTVSHQTMTHEAAIEFFQAIGETYKAKIIADIPKTQTLTLYTQGDFTDLCRGPHVPRTGLLQAFKLTKLAGAYWRGDSNNEMLQRIYGTAWSDKKSLDNYLHQIAEAEKRDHRKLGKKLDLFHIQEEAPGMIFWHPNGWLIFQLIEQKMRQWLKTWGYQEIRTPQLLDRSLWEKSGHWEKFGDDMFYSESEKRQYAVKPMNCPCHIQVFKQGLHSYRDLPLRFAEFGICHRNESSGSLQGLMRVRSFTQDDGHIFCMETQIGEESTLFIQQLQSVYQNFGFDQVQIKLSTRPEKRIGSDTAWDKAEKALTVVLQQSGLDWVLQPGEGAFYGPKLEFTLKDCLNRVWQCGTLQVDFLMPERLEAYYIAEDNSKQTPVMLHRAIFGSFERFIAILLEEYAGRLPFWLAPVQAVIMNISENQQDYAQDLSTKLKDMGIRLITDLRNEKIGFKIREHTLQYIPYLLVVGNREQATNTISVRTTTGEDLGIMALETLSNLLQASLNKSNF